MKIQTKKYGLRDIEDLPSKYLKWVAENWRDDKIATAADREWRERERYGTHFEDEPGNDKKSIRCPDCGAMIEVG